MDFVDSLKKRRAEEMPENQVSDLSAPPSKFSDYRELMASPEEELAAAETKRKMMLMGALTDNLSNRRSFGEFFTGRMSPQNNFGQVFRDMAGTVADPAQRKAREVEAMKTAMSLRSAERGEQEAIAKGDPNSALNQGWRSHYKAITGKEAPAGATGEMIKDTLGLTGTLMGKEIDERIASAGQSATDRRQAEELAFRGREGEAGRALEREKFGAEQAAKIAEEQRRAEEEALATNLPGFEKTGGVKTSAVEAARLRERQGLVEDFTTALDAYDKQLAKNGRFSTSEEMKTAAAALQAKAKALYAIPGMGERALSQIEKLVEDPSSWGTFAKTGGGILDLFGAGTKQRKGLEALREDVTGGFKSQVSAAGYRPQMSSDEKAKRTAELIQKLMDDKKVAGN